MIQPFRQVTVGQPTPPADMQDLPQIEGVDSNNNQQKGYYRENPKLAPELRPVVLLQRVVKVVVPLIEAHVQGNGDEVQRDDCQEQPACRPFFFGIPIWPGNLPCLAEETPFGRHSHHRLRPLSPRGVIRFNVAGTSCPDSAPNRRPPPFWRWASAVLSDSLVIQV